MRRALAVSESANGHLRLRNPAAIALLCEMAAHEMRAQPAGRHPEFDTMKLSVPRHSQMEDRP